MTMDFLIKSGSDCVLSTAIELDPCTADCLCTTVSDLPQSVS